MIGNLASAIMQNGATLESGVEAASSGLSAVTSLVQNPPALLKRFYYYCFYNSTTLTDPDAKIAFDLFYESVKSILNNTQVSYPERLEQCMNRFRNTLGENDVYRCDAIASFDIKQIKKAIQTSSLEVNGKKIKEESLAHSVIDMLLLVPCMQKDIPLSLPKVVFSFLVSMSLEFAAADNPVEKRNLVELMSKVASAANQNQNIRVEFEKSFFESNKTLTVLISLMSIFDRYQKNEYHLADSETILEVAKQLKSCQLERTKKRFNLLLTLTEGGNLDHISSTYDKISNGDLGIGCMSKQVEFNTDNPFVQLLKKSASIFPNVDESYNLITPGEFILGVPNQERIKAYVIKNLGQANNSLSTATPSILFPLLRRCTQRNGKRSIEYIPVDAVEDINIVTQYLFQLATRLAKDVEISLVLAHFHIVTKNNGQEWLVGFSEYIQEFMQKYALSITDDDKLLDSFDDRIKVLLGDSKYPDHSVLEVIAAAKNCNRDLVSKGIVKFKDFNRYRLITTPVIWRVQENLKAFFSMTAIRLAKVDIGMSINKISLLEKDISTTLGAIKNILTKYAADTKHQYKFRCCNLDSSITIPDDDPKSGEFLYNTTMFKNENDKHRERCGLFLSLFLIIVRDNTTETESDKLREIEKEIHQCLASKVKQFTSEDANGITATLFKILELIGRELSTQLQQAQRTAVSAAAVPVPFPAIMAAPAVQMQINGLSSSQLTQQSRINMRAIPNLTTYLKAIIAYIANNPADYDAFEKCWKKLFYLNNNWKLFSSSDYSKIKLYQEKARLHKEKKSSLEYFIKLNNALTSDDNSKIAWAKVGFDKLKQVIRTGNINACITTELMQTYLTESIEIMGREINAMQSELDHIKITLFANINLTIESAESRVISIWPIALKEELKTFLKQYADSAKVECTPDLILQAITSRLFQTDTYQSESEKNEAEDALSMLLDESILAFVNAKSVNEQEFRKTIIQGVLMLGANPMKWIDSVLAASSSYSMKDILDISFIFGQLSEVIISHLLGGSKFLGDTTLYLRTEILQTLTAMNSFILALQHSADSSYWILTLFDLVKKPFSSRATFQSGAVTSECRNDRVLLYLSVIKLIYVIVNHSLVEAYDSPNDSIVYGEAKNKFNVHQTVCKANLSDYSWGGWVVSFIANVGRPGYNEFTALMNAVDKLCGATKLIAGHRAILLRIQEKDLETSDLALRLKAEAAGRREVMVELEQTQAALEHKEAECNKLEAQKVRFIKAMIKRSLPCIVDNTHEGIQRLKLDLLTNVSSVFEEESTSLLKSYIDECVQSYLETALFPEQQAAQVRFFAQRTLTGNVGSSNFLAAAANSI